MKKVVNHETNVATPPALTVADVEQCLVHVQAIETILAPYAVVLSTAQRRQQSKYRKEGDSAIPTLVRLAGQAGLSSKALDVGAMQKQVELANTLLPLLTSVRTLSDTIGDTVLSARGNAWHTATTLYRALVRVAKRNLGLRQDMALVASAFSRKKATPATSGAAATTASDATPAAAEPKAPAATANHPAS
jgi:hypothetical protein